MKYLITILCISCIVIQANSDVGNQVQEGLWAFKPSKNSYDGVITTDRFGDKLKDVIADIGIEHVNNLHFYIGSTPFSGLEYDFEAQFQKDFFSYLEENYPDKLKALKKSSGNMHNPKVVSMQKEFKEAIRNTSLLQEINDMFEQKNAFVSDVSYEKLYFDTREADFKLSSIIWVKFEEKSKK